MRIKTKLQIVAALVIAMTCILGVSFFWTFQISNREGEKEAVADTISGDMLELQLLTFEYVQGPKDRTAQQWHAKRDSINGLVNSSYKQFQNLKQKELLDTLLRDMDDLSRIFLQIVDNENQRESAKKEQAYVALDQRLRNQMFARMQSASSVGPQLCKISRRRSMLVHQYVGLAVIILTLLMTVAAGVALYLTYRGIAPPLEALSRGAEIIGGGNLQHKVGTDAKDEFGLLSRAFDSMTGKIRDSYETLKESEEKFRAFLATANDAMLLINNEGRIEYWNAAAARIFGYSEAEALGQDCHQLLTPPSYHEFSGKGFAHFQATGAGPVIGKTLELTALRKDGPEFPVELSVSAVQLQGKWHAIGIARDITARKQAEEQLTQYQYHLEELIEGRTKALQQSNASLAEAQTLVHLGSWEYDPVQDIITGSEEFYRIFGVSPEHLANYEAFRHCLHADDRERVGQDVSEALANRNPYETEYRIVLPNGQQRHVMARGVVYIDAEGTPFRMVGTVLDITERKKIEEVLVERTQRLELATKSTNLGIWDWDVANNRMLWDDRMLELYGLTRETFPGGIEAWQKGLHPEDRDMTIEECQAALRGEKDWDTEFRVVHPDGTVTYIKANGIVIWNSEGAPIRMLGTNQDITGRKKAEAKLHMTAAELERSNKELQQFAYIASHDLQEPLRKITAFGDRLVMHSGGELDEKGRDYLARMQSAAGRMKQLIEDLLDYSRVTTQAQPFAPVKLAELLGESLENLEYRLAEAGGRVEIAGELPTVTGDRSQLQQLFQNLLANALKYHQSDLPPQILVSGREVTDGQAEITVTDNGIGFDEKYLDRIFLPFQRLHTREEYEGTGIGLAICQKIVQRHGGTLTARSQPGEGSSFVVTLPLAVG